MLTHHYVSSEVSSFPELSILRSQGIALCCLHLLRRWLEPMCRSIRILWDWHPALIRNQVMKSQPHPFGEPQWIITALNACSFWPRFNSGCWIYLGFPLSDVTVSAGGSGGRCFLFVGAHSYWARKFQIDRYLSPRSVHPWPWLHLAYASSLFITDKSWRLFWFSSVFLLTAKCLLIRLDTGREFSTGKLHLCHVVVPAWARKKTFVSDCCWGFHFIFATVWMQCELMVYCWEWGELLMLFKCAVWLLWWDPKGK